MSFPFGLKGKEPTPWKEPQPFEVLRAVENKDLMYLMVCGLRTFHRVGLMYFSGGQGPRIPCKCYLSI